MSHRNTLPPKWRRVSTGRTRRHGDGREGSHCDLQGKRSYSSEGQAKRAAENMVHLHGNVLRPYLCPRCLTWHLTSQEQRAMP